MTDKRRYIILELIDLSVVLKGKVIVSGDQGSFRIVIN